MRSAESVGPQTTDHRPQTVRRDLQVCGLWSTVYGPRNAFRIVGWCAVLVCLLRLSTAVSAEDVTVHASVDKPEVHVGEPFRYRIIVEYPESLTVRTPVLDDKTTAVSIEGSGTELPLKADGRITRAAWWKLASLQPGAVTMPTPVATYRAADGAERSASGPAVTVTVKSVLPEHWESQDIRGAKPTILVIPWWLWAIGATAALAAGGVFWWLRTHRPPVPGPPPKPPHERALDELLSLRRGPWLPSGDIEGFYTRLSAIIRRYVEARFALRAPEMTTEEFLQAAVHSSALSATHQELMRRFLEQCDLVKFAQYRPSGDEAVQAYDAAVRFVQETRPAELVA